MLNYHRAVNSTRWQAARIWHLVTAVITLAALITQAVLTVSGVDALEPRLQVRLFQLISYFTIQSNLLVLLAATTLVADPVRDGTWWRALRAAGLAGITVTAVVHWFLLRPLSDPSGLNYLLDRTLHVVVPLLAVAGWLIFGPRPRMGLRTILLAISWPIGWLVGALVRGAITGWYPYPFLNVRVEGGAAVAAVCVVIAGGLFVVLGLMALADRLLPDAPGARSTGERDAPLVKDAA